MGKCDICNKDIQEPEGYLLTTKEIATSERCWTDYFRFLKDMTGRSFSNLARILPVIVGNRTKSDTPWMICETCATIFSFDRHERREKAKRWRETGEPIGGFALCRVRQEGRDFVIENIDDDAMIAAMKVAASALAALEKEADRPT